MKLLVGRFGVRRVGMSSENGLGLEDPTAPEELLRDLALGLTAMLLFSIGLYIFISGLVIAFLALVL